MGFDFYDSAGKPNRVRNAFADLPLGSMILYAGTAAPYGWLACDGSAVSRTTYADLFTAIGTNYGVGDGSTTFNLPNEDGTIIYAIPVSSRYFGTNPIGSGIINTSNIADSAVTTDKIAAGAVVTADLASSVGNFGAWTSFTPTLTASTTNPTYGTSPTRNGLYCQIGKLVIAHFRIIFGSGMTAGSGTYFMNYPVTAKNNGTAGQGSVVMYDSSANVMAMGILTVQDTLKFNFDYGYNNTYGFATHNTPWAWAVNDQIHGYIMYEAA